MQIFCKVKNRDSSLSLTHHRGPLNCVKDLTAPGGANPNRCIKTQSLELKVLCGVILCILEPWETNLASKHLLCGGSLHADST